MRNSTNTARCGLGLHSNTGNFQLDLEMRNTGQISIFDNLTQTDIFAYSANTWYKIEYIPTYGDETFMIEINDTPYGPYHMENYTAYVYSNTDEIQMYVTDNVTNCYFDNIGIEETPASTGYALNLASTSPETNWGEIGQIVWHGFVIFGLVIALIIYII